MDYEKMLKEGIKDLPKDLIKKERFEIPKVKGHIQGNSTVISNFNQIIGVLGRTQEHVLKYLLKELATPGEITKSALIFRRKVSSSSINDKITKYAEKYVICSECGKPDTKMIKEQNVNFIRCMACGSKHLIKGN
ncbi:translation initiation factor IF-2 subunit beta [Candidatus Woesearchaeota archaeon]|nr:translation initiation factor IF-2 subunit beta [Candidatus Woesearchaeota archaeon]MBL7050545.1 translation initiation factor IF-2 subunit beta [Candidatus Woesearchaeota archaeon]